MRRPKDIHGHKRSSRRYGTSPDRDSPDLRSACQRRDHRSPSRGLDWSVAATSALLIGGFLLDAWTHVFLPQLEMFFTPWHGVLYSGLLATTAVLVVAAIRGRAQGRPLSRALRAGFGLLLLGALIFAAGGFADLV